MWVSREPRAGGRRPAATLATRSGEPTGGEAVPPASAVAHAGEAAVADDVG
jgi:hypothetical protein